MFLQITATDKKDAAVPGEPYGFSVLKEAQALGDYDALKNHGRRVIRIHLHHPEKGLLLLERMVKQIAR